MVPRSTDCPVAVAVRRLPCGEMAAAAPALAYVQNAGCAVPAAAASAAWSAAAAITPQRKRRTATATGASVDRGTLR